MEVAHEGLGTDGADGGWPRRLVWAVLLVWLSPAIAAVLLVGVLGIGLGAAARLAGRAVGQRPISDGRDGAAGVVPGPPHLGVAVAGVRAARRR